MGKGLFLVIFLLELILQLNYLSQFSKKRTKNGKSAMQCTKYCAPDRELRTQKERLHIGERMG